MSSNSNLNNQAYCYISYIKEIELARKIKISLYLKKLKDFWEYQNLKVSQKTKLCMLSEKIKIYQALSLTIFL